VKHLIIDSNNISNISFYRARTVLKEEGDEQKNLVSFSVNVFLNIFHMYLKDNKDYKIYMTWDSRSGANWRKQQLTSYKANRDHSADKLHDTLYDVMDAIKALLTHYPVYQLEIEHAEADDLIYNLCSILEGPKKIISSDGDMLQLPQKFADVKIWHPMKKKLVESPEYDVILYKSICGDPSDGIEGLYKFGPKKTIKAIDEGLKGLTAEQLLTIEQNKKIIDLGQNPSVESNAKIIKETLASFPHSYDFSQIQKSYMTLRLKQHFSNSDLIKHMLDKTNENYIIK